MLDDNKKIVKCDDFTLLSKFIGLNVGRTSHNGVLISTVFLSMEHGRDMRGRPILFETMVFGGPHDGFQQRYCTWQEAEAGHESMLWVLTEERDKKLDELGI